MEESILKYLLQDNDYYGKVYPHLKKSHFHSMENAEVFGALHDYVIKYDQKPNVKELGMFIKNSPKLSDAIRPKVIEAYKAAMLDAPIENPQFLIDETEKYIQKIELSDAIFKSAELIENNLPFEGVIGMVENALSITFDTDVGLRYDQSTQDRFEYYTQKIQGIPTGIISVDQALGSGYRKKTLNLTVAPSHGGKSALLVADAANFLLQKQNVLFVSLEMTEYEIARRIDANLLNHPANDLGALGYEEYNRRLNEIHKDAGKLVIKEYSAGTFNTIKLKSLMNDLYAQDGFVPDAIVIDYIGLMASSRMNMAQAGGTYAYYKLVAEELHGFAKKEDLIMLTAAQLNRGAYDNIDSGLDSIADSLGVIQTADTVLAILSNGQLREYKQALLKFLKNRNTGRLSSHLVEAHFDTMRFLDLDEEAQQIDKISNNVQTSYLQNAVDQNQSATPMGGGTSVLNFD